MKLTPGVDFPYIFLDFFSQTRWEALFGLENGVWQMANKFGKKCNNLSFKIGVLFVGEIYQCILCALATFCLAKSTPVGQLT